METYLPFIKALFSEWYLITLNNPLYAGALAIAVWLLTATLYSIRIAAINRAKAASEKAGSESLNAVQQQLQQSQEHLAETVLQMEKAQLAAQDETQRALALEQLIYQRNQQIAGIIQSLAISFDLGERPILASEDVKADALWQQHDKVINQLTDRLRSEQKAKTELQQTYQAEMAKLAEKDAQLEVLQATLASHSNQLSKLEQAVEEQKAILQQQDNAQQILSDTLQNLQRQPVVTRYVEPEPNAEPIKSAETWQQPAPAQEAPVIPVIEEPQIAQAPVQDKPAEPIIEAPQVEIAQQIEEEKPAEVEPPVAVETLAPFDVSPQPAIEETATITTPDEIQPTVTAAPAKGSLGKIKNLFGKKQPPVKTEPQWSAAKSDETPASNAEQSADETKKAPGKLKGFYSKFRSKDK
jgi:hypothetical protein